MPDPNDPFGTDDDDRTIIRPNPGRRAASRPERVETEHGSGPTLDITQPAGLNPLEKAASLLLYLLGQIRNTSSHPNPDALHQLLVNEIRQFESRAQKAGIAPETIFTARYILCTTVDEFVLGTPWGAASIFRNQSLLRVFHQETGGGEKVFLLLEKLINDPARNIDLLELTYVCLALGFQGRYRVETNGANTLEAIRENLYRAIRNIRGDSETALSPHWQGVDKSLTSKTARLPQWAVLSIVAAALAFIYIAIMFNLHRAVEPLYAALATTGTEVTLVPFRSLSPEPLVRIPDPEPERHSLKKFLAPEISEGLVSVDELPDKTVVLIRGDGLFDSGGDVARPAHLPTLNRIGEELEKTRGRIEVTGHSDNVPISARSRFPSNLALSQARADEVVRILSMHVTDANRFTALGLADTQPVASNDTPDGRRQNRRVEITVFERARSN